MDVLVPRGDSIIEGQVVVAVHGVTAVCISLVEDIVYRPAQVGQVLPCGLSVRHRGELWVLQVREADEDSQHEFSAPLYTMAPTGRATT